MSRALWMAFAMAAMLPSGPPLPSRRSSALDRLTEPEPEDPNAPPTPAQVRAEEKRARRAAKRLRERAP